MHSVKNLLIGLITLKRLYLCSLANDYNMTYGERAEPPYDTPLLLVGHDQDTCLQNHLCLL